MKWVYIRLYRSELFKDAFCIKAKIFVLNFPGQIFDCTIYEMWESSKPKAAYFC